MALFGSRDPGPGSGRRPHPRARRSLSAGPVPSGPFEPVLQQPDGAVPLRRRDRRGRGLRGPLFPPGMPAHRTRAERFDDVVLDTVDALQRRWSAQLARTEFAVEDVPPSDPAPWESGGVPLGRCFPAESGQPARVVVYRRPVEARAADPDDLADLVRDVVVEQVAALLARAPEEIDPDYGGD